MWCGKIPVVLYNLPFGWSVILLSGKSTLLKTLKAWVQYAARQWIRWCMPPQAVSKPQPTFQHYPIINLFHVFTIHSAVCQSFEVFQTALTQTIFPNTYQQQSKSQLFFFNAGSSWYFCLLRIKIGDFFIPVESWPRDMTDYTFFPKQSLFAGDSISSLKNSKNMFDVYMFSVYAHSRSLKYLSND